MRVQLANGHRRLRLLALALALAVSGCVGQVISNNESMAISSMRIIITGQIMHAAMCMGAYAPDFASLRTKGYVPAEFASAGAVVKSGYRFRMTAVKAGPDTVASECGEPFSDFEIVAEPEQPGRTGVRYFKAKSDAMIQVATKADFSDATALQ